MSKPLRVIARSSALSLLQVKEVFSFLPGVPYTLASVQSFGDRNKHISLMGDIDSDFFTGELDRALLDGDADIAVHSAKDLPYPLPAGLELFALFAAQDKTDALVGRNSPSLAELPAGARVGTSSAARKAELLALRPDVTVVSIRGTIEERIAQTDNGYVDALIVATCALKRLGLSERIAEILPFKTHALQGNLAVTGRKGETDVKALFAPFDVRKTYGKVTLVGFGPGNPDLLTLGGDRALNHADIIFHDDLTDRDFLHKYKAEKIYAGKRRGNHSHTQDDINELLYRAAVSGKNTVRLKGGDPMIFARGREEIDFLQSRFVETDVIPGISSGIALAAYTHIPLTCRGVSSSVAFVTGHAGDNVLTPDADTLVYYMGGAHIADIAAQLIAAGRRADTPVALVCNVSLPGQQTWYSTLKELQFSVIKYPTPLLMVAGEVVAFESRNAGARDVLVTGTTAEEYAGYGNVVHTPLIKIEKNPQCRNLPYEPRKEGNASLEDWDWIIFTSRYGVRYFFELSDEIKSDVRCLANVRIASTGRTTTAELRKFHLYPDVESATGSAEGLTDYFRENGLTGKRILLPRSDKGLKELSDALEALGNRITDLPVYINTVNTDAEKTDLSRFGKIVFTSPSCVDAFVHLYGALPEKTQLIAKGKTTINKLKLVLNETI
jgi:uroporphyrinogen III methyltransferase/synthase